MVVVELGDGVDQTHWPRGSGPCQVPVNSQPGEIAGVIAFLASPKASYITGAVIAADGGRTAI